MPNVRFHSSALAVLVALLPAGCGDDPVRRDVVLISIDTLRADRLGCTGYDDARTPRLDALAASGTVFRNGVSPTPLTLPAHATMLSGQLPIEHGARANRPFVFPSDAPTLAVTLQGRGYRTVAVIGGEPLARGCGLERGFDVYDDDLGALHTGSVRLAERTADAVTDAAIARVNAIDDDEPLFLFVHYFDPHSPYAPPPPFDEGVSPYDGEIAFVDQQVGRLLDRLRTLGRLDDAVVVVTSDHGESLGEHGEPTHGLYLYDATVRVPVIVRDGATAAGPRDEQVQLRDLSAFLQDRAAGRAHDLAAAAARGEPAFIESLYAAIHCDHAQLRGLRTPAGMKYLEAGDEELYDLTADADETRDLSTSAAHERDLTGARESLAEMLTSFRQRTSELEGGALPGYLSSPIREETLRTVTRDQNRARPSPASRRRALEHLHEGVRLTEIRLYDAAIDELRAGVALDEGNPTLRFWLGRALRGAAVANEDRAAMVQAIRAFEQTLELRPGHPDARDLLVFDLAQVGRYEDAVELGREADRSGEAGTKTLEALGKVLLLDRGPFADRANPLRNEDEGIELLYRSAAPNPDRADNRLLQFLRDRYTVRGNAVKAAEVEGWLRRNDTHRSRSP